MTYKFTSVTFYNLMEKGTLGRASAISEEEKESNPIYRVTYNKIRNLTKKIQQIEHIESLDRKTLKQAQISKLSRKDEILKEISEHEDFALKYKTIMMENNLVYDKVDDLIKISALLTVGKRVVREDYCPEEVQ